jgi:hypothetical protein
MENAIAAATWLVMIAGVIAIFVRLRRRKGSIGPGASGSIHDLLNEDKRKAIEIIAEERAEARDPETADGSPRPGGSAERLLMKCC